MDKEKMTAQKKKKGSIKTQVCSRRQVKTTEIEAGVDWKNHYSHPCNGNQPTHNLGGMPIKENW